MIDNRDLRLINVSEKDMLLFKYKVFIETVNKCSSAIEAARKLRMTPQAVSWKIWKLRRQGVKVNGFRLRRLQMEALRKMAADLSPEKTAWDRAAGWVKRWQKAASVKEFAEGLGITRQHAHAWARQMRWHKVPLKLHTAKPSYHSKELAKLKKIARETS